MSPFRQLLWLALLTLAGFLLYLALFGAGAAAGITILFYRGIVLALIAALAIGLAGLAIGRRRGGPMLAIAAAALTLSFNLCFLVLFPVTVDRSVSVYLLARIEQQQGSGIAPAELERQFVQGYVVGLGAVQRRIDEQRRSGNVAVGRDGRVRLTAQGRRFMAFSRWVARLFGTDPRLVRPN